MTPERMEAILRNLAEYKAIGEARGIPEQLAEVWSERGWLAIGYDSFQAMCDDRLGGMVLSLPRAERREVVGEMRQRGMSTRAIASAIGVTDMTVRRDLDSTATNVAVDQPERITGLDGRSRPAHRTVAVDLDTGEVLGEMLTEDQWAEENRPTIDDALAADGAVRAANLRHSATRLVYELSRPWPEPAELVAIDLDLTERVAASLERLAARYRSALPTRLSLIKE
jgi:hypothetical protein